MDAGDKRMALGVGGAVAACCAVHLIVLAGGFGALGSVVGGLLFSPYLLVGGLALLTAAVVALTLRRASRTDNDGGCGPSPRTTADPERTEEISRR